MLQETTPTFILNVPQEVDLTNANHVYFTMKQDEDTILNKSDSDLTIAAHQVSVYLTQSDTLKFHKGQATVQLNWTYTGGQRVGTKQVKINIEDNLLKKVVT